MTNYTQINIYRKQAKELGLNTRQYAELIEMPYEIVKDFFYDKEGDYNMEFKNVFRKNMLNKHQEIENNFEIAKIRASEIKMKNNNNVDVLKWYENEYTPELLLKTLELKTRVEFERNYDIQINGKRASKWFYVNITGKRNYDNHEIKEDVRNQFISQLYDILVNGNGDKYKRETPIEVKVFPTQRGPIKSKKYKNKYFEWFRKFDIQQYMKENNISQQELAKKINIGPSSMRQLYYKIYYSKRTLEKLYNYVHSQLDVSKVETLETIRKDLYNEQTKENVENDEIEILDGEQNEEIKEETQMLVDDSTTNDEETTHEENKTTNETSNEILRKILVNRLTDEEKELIKIFGGKLC